MVGGKIECISRDYYGEISCWRLIVIDGKDCCGIYTASNPGFIPGDNIWWHGRTAYWTPRNGQGSESDIPLKRYGCSFDPFFRVPDQP